MRCSLGGPQGTHSTKTSHTPSEDGSVPCHWYSKRLKAAGTAAAAAALCAGAIAAAAPSQAATPRSAIPGTHPSWASASARVSAQPVTTGTVSARVYLAGQDAAGLAAYATAVSSPATPTTATT